MIKFCKFCQKDHVLPNQRESNEHWIWENKNDRRSGGIHYCKQNRLKKKRNAWDNFYKNKHLRCVVSRAINGKLKRRNTSKTGSILNRLPYSIAELKAHLESQFEPGMTWDNYGKWHIDHIIPDSNFNYDNMDHVGFLASWSLSNLRPLWAIDNHRKYNKLIG